MSNRGYAYRSQIGPEAAGRLLLEHLATTYAHSDRSTWCARLAAGEVELDGHVVTGDLRVENGQHLVWHRPPWIEPDVPLSFDIIYEDDDVLAVNKPAGLPTMAAGGFLAHTLLAVVQDQCGTVSPLHRLGRHTSGLVLFARTPAAAGVLAQAWRDHRVTKEYRALIDGDPPWNAHEIQRRIGRVPHHRLGSIYAATDDGRPAHSVVTVVERRGAQTLVDVRITTGRPHQIRIHLAAAGHPLSGDPLYAAGGLPHSSGAALPGDGGYHLHARQLRLAHPRSGAVLELIAEPPPTLATSGRQGP